MMNQSTLLTVVFAILILLTCPPITVQQANQCNDATDDDDDQTCINNAQDQDAMVAPKPKQLPDDFIDPCQDTNEDCPQWAVQGECKNNPNYMLSGCPMSCGTCGRLMDAIADTDADGGYKDSQQQLRAISNMACRDLHDNCVKWANMGECSINYSCKFVQIHIIYSQRRLYNFCVR